MTKFRVEDEIHATFFPLVRALKHYCDDHGRSPETLQDLCPKELAAIPDSKFVKDINFQKVSTEVGWKLTLRSDALGKTRLYIAEEGMPLSSTELQDVVLHYHDTWFVLEPEND